MAEYIGTPGFGKFKGVGENPTQRFVKALPFFLKANPLPAHVVVDRCIVMEVAAHGCTDTIYLYLPIYPTIDRSFDFDHPNVALITQGLVAKCVSSNDFRLVID